MRGFGVADGACVSAAAGAPGFACCCDEYGEMEPADEFAFSSSVAGSGLRFSPSNRYAAYASARMNQTSSKPFVKIQRPAVCHSGAGTWSGEICRSSGITGGRSPGGSAAGNIAGGGGAVELTALNDVSGGRRATVSSGRSVPQYGQKSTY
ncbi:hypothetical protein LMG29739_06339 [Paraburkholderia solisilvae]|uniref:Uncharacterized protein n=1 Tax=Paraburkholderia solisilvae TaxID=624376 RepID=A0A6J5F6E2_9BURK|nr:hypothetical protein LMG29739_06339 [Paraburkholderia solisilvae]